MRTQTVNRSSLTQVIAGLVLVALGLLFLGQQAGWWPALDIWRLSPAVLVVLGVSRFLSGPSGRRGGGLMLAAVGGLLLLHTYNIMSLAKSWPLYLVAAGVSVLIDAGRPRPAAGKASRD